MSEPTLNFFIQTHQEQFAVPCELLKKNLKAVQKLIEKSRKLLTDEVAKVHQSSTSSKDKLETVRKMIRSFEQTLRKLRILTDKDNEYRQRLVARVARLALLQQYTVNTALEEDAVLDFHNEDFIHWLREEADLLIVDYLIKSNSCKDQNVGSAVAQKLSQLTQLPIQELIDCDIYESYNQVFLSIMESHDLDLITGWYNDNRNALKKIGLNLQFEIHYCRFLYLINQGQTYEAISFSRENLAPYAQRLHYSPEEEINFPLNLDRLSEVGAPLASSPHVTAPSAPNLSLASVLLQMIDSSETSKYLLNSRIQANLRWARLAECFTQDFMRIYGISHNYPLCIYLSAGLSCLKTKSCYCNNSNTIYQTEPLTSQVQKVRSDRDLVFRGPNFYYDKLQKTNQCPVCSPELYSLSRSLPYGLLITSIFSDPICLPNGNIYSMKKLKAHANQGTRISDPLTKEVFMLNDCVKVFPA